MLIHPKARPVMTKLKLPTPIRKAYEETAWDTDLSNNTNPYLEIYSHYPDVKQEDLKNLYLSRAINIQNENYPELTPENLLFTVGSMEAIDILLRTFCEPNQDRICVVHPSFAAYEHWGSIHNLEIQKIPLLGENLDTFSIEDVVKMNPKMVFLPNPNNPVGTILEPGLIEKLCQAIDGFVVVDEAYIEFSHHPSSLRFLEQHKNLVILHTLSKAWGLAGARCGVILADELIIQSLRYVQLTYAFSSLTQDLVRQTLTHPEKVFESWERIKKDRAYCMQALSQLPIVEKVFPSEANFIFLIVKDSQKVMKKLHDHNIHVLDCSFNVPHAIRISLGTPEENQMVLEAMREVSSD